MMYYYKRTCIILIGCFLLNVSSLEAQNQNKADSLISIYESGSVIGEENLVILDDITFFTNSPEESLKYSDILIKEAQKDSNFLYMYRAYSQKGQAYRMMGDMPEALKTFFKASNVASKLKEEKFVGGSYLTIADVYSEIGNSENAATYYNKSIDILRETNDSLTLGTALLNSGYDYFLRKKYDEALLNYNESSLIFKIIDYPVGRAYTIGNIGMVYAELGKDKLAEERINTAITTLEEYEDYYAIADYLSSMSDVYMHQKKISKALEYDHKSLDLATKQRLKVQIRDSNLSLSELYEQLSNLEATLHHFKEYVIYKDSINDIKKVEDIADMRTNFEVSQEQDKTTISEQKRKTQLIILFAIVGVLFLIGILAYNLFKKNKFVKATNKIIATERDRSDKLLLNILPEETAKELKDKGKVEAKQYPSVTVLFTDFVGFTRYAEKLSPEELVRTIDHYFSNFDAIMEKYGLEKIKTIGDAYMAVGGLSFDTANEAKEMVLAAQEMSDFVTKTKQDSTIAAEFDIRIGINTGSVVAGVVGTKKFAYDIWGDTVNIASRMESNSEPGRINISEDTYHIIKSYFDCEYRGELAVKNRGKLKMYFLI